MGTRLNLLGKTFGYLKVKRDMGSRNGYSIWRCKCTFNGCSNYVTVEGSNLKSGNTKSCGCYDMFLKTKHNLSRTREYAAYIAMIDRCYSKHNARYADYGGRGIKVCKRWLDNLEGLQNFINDMGKRPLGHSLERVNNSKNYSPKNCVWGNAVVQANNRRSNRMITFKNETLTLAQMCRKYNLPYSKVKTYMRYKNRSFAQAYRYYINS